LNKNKGPSDEKSKYDAQNDDENAPFLLKNKRNL
jgi:hypothetical protein